MSELATRESLEGLCTTCPRRDFAGYVVAVTVLGKEYIAPECRRSPAMQESAEWTADMPGADIVPAVVFPPCGKDPIVLEGKALAVEVVDEPGRALPPSPSGAEA